MCKLKYQGNKVVTCDGWIKSPTSRVFYLRIILDAIDY